MAITDLTGTTWLIDDTLQVPDEFFNLVCNDLIFTSNNELFGGLLINRNINYDAFMVQYGSDLVYDYNNLSGLGLGWISQPYRTITITGGDDVTNSYLIAWLQANATQQTAPTPTTQIALGRAFIKKQVVGGYELVPVSVMQKVTGSGGSSDTLQPLAIGYTSEWQPVTYTITTNITNGTYSGDTTIQENGSATVTLSANSGYALPSTITVSGASYTYNSTTGVISLSNDISNVTITAVCENAESNYLTFSSPSTFTLNVVDNTKYWDGTLYYSTDTTTWNEWGGTTTLSSSSSGTTKYLYLRGTNNTYITGSSASPSQGAWVLTGSDISCNGNIENLLDYQTVANGQHPTMASKCYYQMFRSCSSLTTAPELSATTLASNCYSNMFNGCSSLTTAPSLPATTLASNCYQAMFSGCSSLTIPAIMAGGSTQATPAVRCCYRMYYNCTALNIYTSSSGHTPFYRTIAYSRTTSTTNYQSSFQMFYNCKINGTKSTIDYLTPGGQLYY